MTYEAGKHYKTEKGGVVGPIKLDGGGTVLFLEDSKKTDCGYWNIVGKPYLGDGTNTEIKYGRLTTEAQP